MARYLILAQSKRTADALGAWLGLLGEDAQAVERVIWAESTCLSESDVCSYEGLVKQIEARCAMSDGSLALNSVTILVDAVTPVKLNALDESGWNNLIALLILTFPEVRWIFGVMSAAPGDFPSREHGLDALLHSPRREPLLDPTGLREWVRKTSKLPGQKQCSIPLRNERAAAIDEEKSFAYFHAYTAYRFGFRVDVVTSWALMDMLFGEEAKARAQGPGHGCQLLMEDMSLNFPDRPARIHLLGLDKTYRTAEGAEEKGRAGNCPLLDSEKPEDENSEFRILITTGQSGPEERVHERNADYLKRKKRGRGGIVLKPVGGMFDVWSKLQMFDPELGLCGGGRPGFARGFVPLHKRKDDVESDTSGHGAPGKLMLAAETLLRRAEVFRNNACTVKDFIKGAVLASEAAELLGGKTPTLTLAALTLKHEYEACAECEFVGVGYHFNVTRRADEIRTDVATVSEWFGRGRGVNARLDARVVILNCLAAVFRESGQFEEEQECMVEVRRLHRRLLRPPGRNPFLWAIHGALTYAEWLLATFHRFMGALAVWVITLTVGWFMLDSQSGWPGWRAAIQGTCGAFFGGNPAPDKPDASLLILSCFAVACGVFHIGVFISYLYSLVSRR